MGVSLSSFSKKSSAREMHIVKETDLSGSGFRIRNPREKKQAVRPETPKLNILELQNRRQQAMAKVNTGKRAPNQLNPYAKLGSLAAMPAAPGKADPVHIVAEIPPKN
jgi:hypothetical protein